MRGSSSADGRTYHVTSPNPNFSGMAPGTEAIWGRDLSNFGLPANPGYFDAAVSLQPGAHTVFATPSADPQQPAGLSAHIVRVDSNLDNLCRGAGCTDLALINP